MKKSKNVSAWEENAEFIEALEYTRKKTQLIPGNHLDFCRLLTSNCIKYAVPLDILIEYISNEDRLKGYRQRLSAIADEAYKRKSNEFGQWANKVEKPQNHANQQQIDLEDVRYLFAEFFDNLQLSNRFFIDTLKIYVSMDERCTRGAMVSTANSLGMRLNDDTIDKYISYMLTANVLDWDGDEGYVKCLPDNNKHS